MPLDCNGNELKVGDKVRRHKDFRNAVTSGWKEGDNILEILRLDSERLFFSTGELNWCPRYFEKVNEMDILSCIRVTPAQAEKVEIVKGPLSTYFNIEPADNTKVMIHLLDSAGHSIGCMSSKTLREHSILFSKLANALDRVNKE